MTRKEAIEILSCRDNRGLPITWQDGFVGAIDTAIEALQEQKTGKWKPWKAYYGKDHKSWSDELKCSECGFKWGDEEYKYCPMCRAEMEEHNE